MRTCGGRDHVEHMVEVLVDRGRKLSVTIIEPWVASANVWRVGMMSAAFILPPQLSSCRSS